jgi:hypothetical protein
MTFYIVRSKRQKDAGQGGYFASPDLGRAIDIAQSEASKRSERMYVQVWKPATNSKRKYVQKRPTR